MNLKKEVIQIINDTETAYFLETHSLSDLIDEDKSDLADKLIALFTRNKKEYALMMCKQTVNNIDRSTEWLDTEEQYKQFIPQELSEVSNG